MTHDDFELFVEELPDELRDFGAERLPDGIDLGSPFCCFASFTSVSCPGSTAFCVGSFSSGC